MSLPKLSSSRTISDGEGRLKVLWETVALSLAPRPHFWQQSQDCVLQELFALKREDVDFAAGEIRMLLS